LTGVLMSCGRVSRSGKMEARRRRWSIFTACARDGKTTGLSLFAEMQIQGILKWISATWSEILLANIALQPGVVVSKKATFTRTTSRRSNARRVHRC
jgi:hypothetical protein